MLGFSICYRVSHQFRINYFPFLQGMAGSVIRVSFRQSMLAGFMLIALLLGGAAARSWLVVEQFAQQSRRGSAQALELTEAIQDLGERTVDLERSARQYLVLSDAAVLTRFEDNFALALAAIDRLQGLAAAPLTPLLVEWRKTAEELRRELHQAPGESGLLPLLARLSETNTRLSQEGKRWIDEQGESLLAQLDENRLRLAQQLIAAIIGTLAVALVMGWWLGRPIRRLEQAIERLGENRFDEPVAVRGPDDLRQVGRRLEWLRQRLAELEADREQTLRHVSHELKTPLTALREGISLLQEQVVGQLGDDQREVVDILQHNVVTLQRQIESLLDLNAASFAARRLKDRPVLIRQLVSEAVRRRELQIQSRGLRVTVEGNAGTVRLDEEKMHVVLDNLLSNAIDFSPENGEIRLVIGRARGRVGVDVIDQGPGVAAEDAERIFQPFVQGRREAPEPRQGSGVGLSIVRELMQAMDGTVVLLSGDKGAHFRIEVPDGR